MIDGSTYTVSEGVRTTVTTATPRCPRKPTQSLARRLRADAVLECALKIGGKVARDVPARRCAILAEKSGDAEADGLFRRAQNR